MKAAVSFVLCLGAMTALGAVATGAAAAPLETGQAAYNRYDFAAAARLWTAAASAGDTSAAFSLGLLYDLGQGVAADPVRAFQYYLKAAQGGMPAAEFDVAVMFDGGRGVPHDVTQAALWYARAAAHGHGRAAYNLAQLYHAGEGVPANDDEAASWYRAAAAHGIAAAADHAAKPAPSRGFVTLGAPIGVTADPAAVIPGSGGGRNSIELAWLAPKQPLPVRFTVTIASADGDGVHEVFSGSTDLSAMLVDLPNGPADYVWRVYTVADGISHYAASEWSHINIGKPGS